MATYVKVAGAWKVVTTDAPSNGVCGYVKVNGTWRTVNQSYVRINGVWRSTCTAPGQQPAAIPETICYRPNYCLNGTNGTILPTTEPCYLADGVTLGTRTAPYTCQTDPGCSTYTVLAGVCTAPDPIIQVVSEQVGDCEFWGGISGCTSGNAKRVTKRYSDSSVKVSYSCCNPLLPNLKYYCTLRPFSTGTCLNELKDTDFTGTVVAGQGEWVCEAAGITSFPSCATTENCTNPKSEVSTYEGCGYLSTGQRLVTSRTFQSWCDTTQDTVVGECVGEVPKCGGAYCGTGSGEEQYSEPNCGSGYGIRNKCVTPEGCSVIYSFRRCVPVVENIGGGGPTTYQVTEICYTRPGGGGQAESCRQYSTTNPPATGESATDASCLNYVNSNGQFQPCPEIPGEVIVVPNCTTIRTDSGIACTTSDGRAGTQTRYINSPSTCPNTFSTCVANATSTACCQDDDEGYCLNVGSDGYGDGYNRQYDPCGYTSCPGRYYGRTFCGVPAATGPTGGGTKDCTSCKFGQGTQSCGTNGTQTYCITDVGCPDIYGPCVEPATATGAGNGGAASNGSTSPTSPQTTTLPVNPETNTQLTYTNNTDGSTTYVETNVSTGGTTTTVVEPIVLDFFGPGFGESGLKSININTLVRTRDGLVAAHDLKVGDKLLSADIVTFPYDNLLVTDMDLIEWIAQNPQVNLVETEIVNIRTRISKWAVIVDSDIFSDTHYIMVKRGDVTSFVKALDLEDTDLIWSYAERDWISISILKKVDVNHEVVSIDCEPYDIFFTERMLTHDSNTVD